MAPRLQSPDFVGRVEELALLDAALDTVAAGRASTVLIGGEAGIGKTRLVDELADRAREREALVATGVCVPFDGGALPYGPVVGVLRDLVRQLGEPAAEAALGPLAAGFAAGAATPTTGPPDAPAAPRMADELARTRLFESVLAGVSRLAARSVVVLIVEDLHWADSASADLLGFLARNLSTRRVLLVGTYRTDELGAQERLRWLHELARHASVVALQLGGFDRDETAELLGGLLGHAADWPLVDAVWARSQGNPFFAEELTAVRNSPVLSAEFRGLLLRRLDDLSTDARTVGRLAAAAGLTVEHELLVATEVLPADALDRAIAEAVDQHVLVVDGDGTGYRFRHALLREAVDSALLPGERARLHRQLATAITANPAIATDRPGQRAAELASHWWAAGAWPEALDASLTAAVAATDVWAFSEALVHLERALSALDRVPASAVPAGTDRLGLLERAADIAYLGDAGQHAVDLARAAIDEAVARHSAPSRLADGYARLGRNEWAIGDSDAAFAAYRKAADLVPADEPSVELARVLSEQARGLMMMSRFVEAEEICMAALDVAGAVGARLEEGHVLDTLGCCRAATGDVEGGIALVRQAGEIGEEVADADLLNRAFTGLSSLLVEASRLEEGAALVFDSAVMGEELWGVRLNGAAGNSVDALIRLGRHREAEALLAQTGELGVGSCTSAPSLHGGTIAARRGRFDEAARLFVLADELTARMSDVQTRGVVLLRTAELALLEGRPDDAQALLERALALAAGTDDEMFRPEMDALAVRALADGVEAALARGRRTDVDKARLLALGFVEDVQALLAAPARRGWRASPRATGMAALCVAEASRLDGSDPERWRDAAQAWEVAGEPYHVAWCRWREAEALLEGRRGRQRAVEHLQQAWRIAVDLEARPLADRIEALARRARVPLDEAEPAAPSAASSVGADLGLTPREVEVLAQLATGRTDREIAEVLFISKKTASVHVSNVLRKLDVTNRVEAGRIGQAHGLG